MDNPVVTAVACIEGVSLERNIPIEEIEECLRAPGNVVWVDMQDPGPAEMSLLVEEFGVHPLALEDAGRGLHRPKASEYRSHIFLVTYSPIPNDSVDEFRTAEVDLFIGRNYVVTLHNGPVPAIQEALSRWTRGGRMLREGVGFLLYTVIDAIVDAYTPVIAAIESELEEHETGRSDRFSEKSIEMLLGLKRSLFEVRRVLYPFREAFNLFLRRDQPLFSADTRVYLQDVFDNLLRLIDVVDVQMALLSSALDAQLAVASQRLNETVKKLTVITVVVALASSVFSAWGMNVAAIPLSESAWGFWAIVGGTIVVIAVTLILSRTRGWL